MATSTIKKLVHTATKSGTTNAQGALDISSAVSKDKTVLSVACTNKPNAMCIPWLYDNSTWYAKIVGWESFGNDYANTSVTLTIRYID